MKIGINGDGRWKFLKENPQVEIGIKREKRGMLKRIKERTIVKLNRIVRYHHRFPLESSMSP